MDVDARSLDETSAYKLLIGSIIPRPIAWVSTLSTEGVPNIAPISFFTCVGRKPPRILTVHPAPLRQGDTEGHLRQHP